MPLLRSFKKQFWFFIFLLTYRSYGVVKNKNSILIFLFYVLYACSIKTYTPQVLPAMLRSMKILFLQQLQSLKEHGLLMMRPGLMLLAMHQTMWQDLSLILDANAVLQLQQQPAFWACHDFFS